MTSRARRLLATLSAVPLAAAMTVFGTQAAYAEDNSSGAPLGVGSPQGQAQQPVGGATDPAGDINEVEDLVSDRRVKRDITPVDWSR